MTVRENTLKDNQTLQAALAYAKKENKAVHLMGLVSDGGVHAHIEHLKNMIDICEDVNQVYIHAFTDGRDTDPKGGIKYLTDLQNHIQGKRAQLASITGRYYAMDRDKRWERIKLCYDALVYGTGKASHEPIKDLEQSYHQGVTDEFIKPIIALDKHEKPIATVQDEDVVICFNFRTDRARQITQVLTQEDMPEHGMQKKHLRYLTMTQYDERFKGVEVLFKNEFIKNTIGEVLAKYDKKQIRIAETEKYPHVTFFFSGGDEKIFEGEERIMCPSPKVATYDLQPKMSAEDITKKIIPKLEEEEVDFVCLNFANPDMVGHTGVLEATIKACETVDECASKVVATALEHTYTSIIIADHGNADMMKNSDGTPHTAHTTNLVPCILVDEDKSLNIESGVLGDIAPSILYLMGIDRPQDMTGSVLVKK